MNTYAYVPGKVIREMAEMTVYMKWWFEMEYRDDPSDPYHSYAIVQSYNSDDTKEDFVIEISADCPEELDQMWDELKRDIRRMIRYITIENPDHK
jgi:hypothetical protein